MIPDFKIVVDYHGPSLCDMLPILDRVELSEVPQVRWAGTRQDFLALEKVGSRKFLLVVPDAETRDKTLWRLDGALEITTEDLDVAKGTLVHKDQHHAWRAHMAKLDYPQRTMLICKVMAAALLAGKKPRQSSVSIARECVLDHIDPTDADILIRLRTAR